MGTVLRPSTCSRSPVVHTTHGAVQGLVAEGVHVFLGIPYAAPPFGERSAAPTAPGRGLERRARRDPAGAGATAGGAARRRVARSAGAAEDWGDVAGAFAAVERAAGSEECLNLNVWTPDPGAAGLPVMVWIQGGMFELSSTAAYDGSRFARDGVVCVVINWRPGAEGFLYLGDGIANLGLLDQVAALEWVRDNIAGFGGDPDNVTVFGESAGAMSIGALLAMPAARGLFHRAILQSGAAQHVTPPEDAARIAGHLADLLGVDRDRDAIAAAGVRPVADRAGTAEGRAARRPGPDPLGRLGGHHHHAVAARRRRRRPARPTPGAHRRGVRRRVSTCSSGPTSTTGGSGSWSAGPSGRSPTRSSPDRSRTYGYQCLAAYGLDPDTALAAYRNRYPSAGPGELLAKVQTDWWMRIPAIRLADAHAADGGGTVGTYMYEFAWPSPGLGAVHALEVPFVFDTAEPGRAAVRPAARPEPAPGPGPHHARRVGALRHQRQPRLAAVRPAHAGPRCGSTPPRSWCDDPRSWERALWHGIR